MSDRLPKAASIPLTGVPDDTRSRSTQPELDVVELFDSLRNPVLRYLLGIGLPFEDGEEIAQEVFLALFQHLRAGKPRDNLRGWVFRVAHNLGLKRRGLTSRRDTSTEHNGSGAAMDPGPNPEDQMANMEHQARLVAVMNALPVQDRACLQLRAEGLRYREIADVVGMSLGAVSASLARSMARFVRATAP